MSAAAASSDSLSVCCSPAVSPSRAPSGDSLHAQQLLHVFGAGEEEPARLSLGIAWDRLQRRRLLGEQSQAEPQDPLLH